MNSALNYSTNKEKKLMFITMKESLNGLLHKTIFDGRKEWDSLFMQQRNLYFINFIIILSYNLLPLKLLKIGTSL